jgi:hypothetical protein
VQRTLGDNIASRGAAMRKVCEKSTSAIVKIAGNACAAGTFVIRMIAELQPHRAFATHHDVSTPRCADSESRILAMKKFSRGSRRRLIAPRQIRFFERIAIADSRPAFGRAMPVTSQPRALADRARWSAPDVERRSDAEFAVQ